MANVEYPDLTIPLLGGSRKKIKINFAAVSRASRELGEDDFLERIQKEGNLKNVMTICRVHALLWAGLKSAGGSMTFDEVGEELDGSKMKEYVEALTEGLIFFMTKKTVEEHRKEAEAKAKREGKKKGPQKGDTKAEEAEEAAA